MIYSTSALANPVAGTVAAGSATITSPTPNTVIINQSTDKAIINWQSFNIGAGEKTQFIQPNSSSSTLNRINPSQGASQIYGHLIANGQIILINGAGIFFGPGARVDVGGLIASTVDMTDKNFLIGKYVFDQPSGYAGSIINQGQIIATRNGLIALIGIGVSNTGLIKANLGSVILASGSQFTITFAGDQLLGFAVDASTMQSGVDPQGRALKNGVSNSGKIIANGGDIILSAKTASTLLDNAINMSGVLQANSVTSHNGEIILIANDGTAIVSGKIIAAGIKKNASGGIVKVLGAQVLLIDNASIDVSGNTGGGEVLIGGSSQGLGQEQNANNTYIAPSVHINANALQNGNGGNVVTWSTAATAVYGHISAQGGTVSGNGGSIETSGAYLDVAGITINVSALHGMMGTWLLDPENLTIQAAGTTTATASGTPTTGYTANTDNSIVTVADLQNALVNANILIQTGVSGAQAGDITVANAITWNNTNTLTLSAYHSINIDAAITNAAGGSLSLRADNTGTSAGTITFAGVTPQITMSGGGAVNFYYNPTSFATPTNYANNVSTSGGTLFTPYMLVNSAAELQNMNTNLSGNYALGKSITLSGNFIPIGSAATPFTGQFNGLSNTISDLTITNATPNTDLGLFGATNGATIANISLNTVAVTQTAANTGGSIYIGSLVGFMTGGTITNASVIDPTINVSGTNYGTNGSRGYYDVGALIGATFGGTISNSSSSNGNINDNVNTTPGASMIAFQEIGGFIGGIHNSAILQTDTSSTAVTVNGNVTIAGSNATGELLVGGFAGRLDTLSSVLDSVSSGAVAVTSTISMPAGSGAAYVLVGGLLGLTSIANSPSITPAPTISDSHSTSAVTLNATLTDSPAGSAEFLVGGLLGQSNAVVSNAYSTGPVVANLASDASAAGNYFYAGGLAADSFTVITNSYSNSSVTVSGTNNGSQVEVGGLVGEHVSFYDKEVTDSYSTGAVTVDMNNLNAAQLFVGGLIGSIIYYGNAAMMWPFENNYSTSSLTVDGQNNASLAIFGGLIGANGQDAGDPGGNIVNSFSQGLITTQIATSNAGITEFGGFIGAENGASAALLNNFWDTDTSGFNQNQGVGNQAGTVAGLTPGCFSGDCLNGGTADLSSENTFTNAGWDFANIWSINESQSYPYLTSNPAPYPSPATSTAPVVLPDGSTPAVLSTLTSSSDFNALKSLIVSAVTLNYTFPGIINNNVDIAIISNGYSQNLYDYDARITQPVETSPFMLTNQYVYNPLTSQIPQTALFVPTRQDDEMGVIDGVSTPIPLVSLPAQNNFASLSWVSIVGFVSMLVVADVLTTFLLLMMLKKSLFRLRRLAAALSAANRQNVLARNANGVGGVAITNATDAAKLLKGGVLPQGYTISPYMITAGVTVTTCVLTDQASLATALFTLTGVK